MNGLYGGKFKINKEKGIVCGQLSTACILIVNTGILNEGCDQYIGAKAGGRNHMKERVSFERWPVRYKVKDKDETHEYIRWSDQDKKTPCISKIYQLMEEIAMKKVTSDYYFWQQC